MFFTKLKSKINDLESHIIELENINETLTIKNQNLSDNISSKEAVISNLNLTLSSQEDQLHATLHERDILLKQHNDLLSKYKNLEEKPLDIIDVTDFLINLYNHDSRELINCWIKENKKYFEYLITDPDDSSIEFMNEFIKTGCLCANHMAHLLFNLLDHRYGDDESNAMEYDKNIATYIIETLEDSDSSIVIDTLIFILKYRGSVLKKYAANSLIKIGNPVVLPLLDELTNHFPYDMNSKKSGILSRIKFIGNPELYYCTYDFVEYAILVLRELNVQYSSRHLVVIVKSMLDDAHTELSMGRETVKNATLLYNLDKLYLEILTDDDLCAGSEVVNKYQQCFRGEFWNNNYPSFFLMKILEEMIRLNDYYSKEFISKNKDIITTLIPINF